VTGVLVCDGAADMRALLRDALDADPDLRVVGEAADGAAALRLAAALQPDVVLLDISMPGDGSGPG
jgi:chemotaxis response regulator CheB